MTFQTLYQTGEQANRLAVGALACLFAMALYFAPVPHSRAQPQQDNRQLNRERTQQSNRASERRIALVIGNGAYTKSPPLKNPPNDAKSLGDALREFGFEVTSGVNKSQREMKQLIREFGKQVRTQGGVGLFYFAGHGVQMKGRNYLIPVDAEVQTEADLEDQGVDVNYILNTLDDAQNALNIVVLDACRNNPFARSLRSAQNGLAQIKAPSGTLIAYSTALDSTAADGDGTNSPYTAELMKQIRIPGVFVETIFRRVTERVSSSTAGKQEPWFSANVKGDFYFRALDKEGELYSSAAANVAESTTSKSTDKKGQEAATFNRQGVGFFNDNKFGDAANAFVKAAELDPFNAQYHRNLGETMIRLEKFEQAVTYYRQAVLLEPNNPDGHNGLGLAFTGLERYDEAVDQFEKSLRLDRDNFEAHEGMWFYYYDYRKNYPKALEEAQILRRLGPKSPRAFHHLGAAFAELEKYQEVIEAFKEALRLQPEFYSFYTWIVDAYLKLGKLDEARRVANEVNQQSPYWGKELYDRIEAEPTPSASASRTQTKVHANDDTNGWSNSGLFVRRGQTLRITASGRISLGNGYYSDPGGLLNLTDPGKLMPNHPTGALIAVIGDDTDDFIFIGASHSFMSERDGYLFLGVNEEDLSNNSGAFDVVVTRNH